MPAGLKWASMILAVAVMLPAGCDNAQNVADKDVARALEAAQQDARSTESGAADVARQRLQDAAGNAAASDSVRAAAKSALAQAELESAHALIRQIDTAELNIARLVWEITQLAQQIRTSNSAAAGYAQYDPEPARQAIAAKVAEAQGGPGKAAWFTHDQAIIPTLSAVRQDVARLEGDIAQLEEQVKNLTEERAKLTADAEEAAAQAEQLKGDRAVEVFKRSSDFRKQAGNKAVEIDKLNAAITTLQRNLAIAKGQEATLNEVIAQLQQQAATLDAGWKQIDEQIARHRQLAEQIVGQPTAAPSESAEPPATAGASMMEKAAALARMAAQVDALRSDAQARAEGAATNFGDAYTAADAFRRNMEMKIREPKNTGRPELEAWKTMSAVVDPLQLRLQQAAALRTLGALQTSAAASVSRRISLGDTVMTALKGTSLAVPPELQVDLGTARKTAIDQAQAAYEESDKLLGDIIDAGQVAEELQSTARIARALTLYGWSRTALLAGDERAAAQHMNDAIKERNLAAEHNASLPALPAEFGEAPKTVPPPAEPTAPAAAENDEQAVRAALNAFADAVEKGDVEAAVALGTFEPDQEQMYRQTVAVIMNVHKFREAVKAKSAKPACRRSNSSPTCWRFSARARSRSRMTRLSLKALPTKPRNAAT